MDSHLAAIAGQGGHRYACRVYYEDTDAGGVVYHGKYLGMAERARTEALRDMGVPHAELASRHGLCFVVRRVALDFAVPARLDDLLTVHTAMVAVRGASMRLRQTFFCNETPTQRALLVAEVRLACVRLADLRPSRIPERWRAALAALA